MERKKKIIYSSEARIVEVFINRPNKAFFLNATQ